MPPADAKHYVELLGVHKGDVFSRTAVIAGSDKIREASKATSIDPLSNVDEAKHAVDLTFEIVR